MPKVRFGDVVREVKHNIDRNNNPYEFYVAGDHMDTADLTIHRRGCFTTDYVGPAFVREFKKGQVLYGSRRTYLKKVAVADFDGVTANTTFVLETKNPDIFLQTLLPFVMLTDSFTEWSVKRSKGSTNPYVLFSDLADFEFELPDIEEQRQVSDVLWACFRLRERYEGLIQQCDALVQSQFVEMFESEEADFPKVEIQDACASRDDIKCGPFGTQLKQAEYQESGVGIWGIPQINSEFSIQPDAYVTPEKAKQLSPYSLIPGDIAMSRKGNVGQCAIFPNNLEDGIIASDVLRIRVDQSRLLPKFMQFQLHHSWNVKQQILRVSDGAVMAGINVTKLKSIEVFIPPMSLQQRFVSLADQIDKSKYSCDQLQKMLCVAGRATTRKRYMIQ